MKICEIFPSICGEGRYAGTPALFVRTSGCTRKCTKKTAGFECDTKYHSKFKEMTVGAVVKKIEDSKLKIIVWTGGTVELQMNDVQDVMSWTVCNEHHLETNGDLIQKYVDIGIEYFDYICFSPKDFEAMAKAVNFIQKHPKIKSDIKVVTDGDVNKDLIPFATMLMPLTLIPEAVNKNNYVDFDSMNKIINQKVWNLCVKLKKSFCLRQHITVWGNKRGV